MLKLTVVFVYLFFTLSILASTEKSNATSEPAKKNQIEDIFIWKMSDELQLSAKQEKKFGDVQRSLNKRKFEISEEIKNTQIDIKKMEKKPSAVDQMKLIKKNRSLLLQLNQLSIEEFDSMKKLVGAEKFLEYLYLKQVLNSKFKSLALGHQNEKSEEKSQGNSDKLPPSNPPIITEEK